MQGCLKTGFLRIVVQRICFGFDGIPKVKTQGKATKVAAVARSKLVYRVGIGVGRSPLNCDSCFAASQIQLVSEGQNFIIRHFLLQAVYDSGGTQSERGGS